MKLVDDQRHRAVGLPGIGLRPRLDGGQGDGESRGAGQQARQSIPAYLAVVSGYLMSNHHTQAASEFICIDGAPDAILLVGRQSGRPLGWVTARGLLGEGWDAPAVNCLVDMTVAATSVSVRQMRGRSLRLDPDRVASYVKLQGELEESTKEPWAKAADNQQARIVHRAMKKMPKKKR